MNIPEPLKQAAEAVKNGNQPGYTVREILRWYGYERRGSWISQIIPGHFKELKIKSVPDFEAAYIDATIYLVKEEEVNNGHVSTSGENGTIPADSDIHFQGSVEATIEKKSGSDSSNLSKDPSHRISRLKAANTKPINVAPSDSVQKAISLMLTHDFSQLPVMDGDRDVKGMFSWKSLGRRTSMGKVCLMVKDGMDPHQVLPSSASMFDAIREVAKHDCVLVREPNRIISGIVTAADISEQFRILSEPFLLLGDIENALRRLIDSYFSLEEMRASKDEGDTDRKIESVADLTFGEYIQMMGKRENWVKLNLGLDRKVIVDELDDIREIRNDVMHFDPDGIDETQLADLRRIAKFLEDLPVASISNGSSDAQEQSVIKQPSTSATISIPN